MITGTRKRTVNYPAPSPDLTTHEKEMFQRSRMDEIKLEHVLGFFFIPSFLHISSYGSKEVMLESGTEMYGSGCGGG